MKTELPKSDIKKPEPVKTELPKSDIKKPELVKTELPKSDIKKPEPVKTEPQKSEPVKPDTTQSDTQEPTIKEPEVKNTPSSQSIQFSNNIDSIDPNAENNPKGSKSQGFRGENQLVVYSSSSGEHTGTNKAGTEAIVVNNIVTELKSGNSPIPNNGFVVSGHGSSAQWIRRIIKRGATIQVNPDSKLLTVEITPRVYFNQIETDLERITALSPEERGTRQASLTAVMGQIEDCQIRLKQLIPGGKVTPLVLETFQECRRLVNQAYIQVVSSNPNEFRGIWVRPLQNSSAEIQHIIADLKALKIHDIFLETYYQGKTIYPSQVMQDYGLPKQHRQFEGTDILKEWIEAAHAQGLRVHTWVQVFFAGNQQDSMDSLSDLLAKYPDWRNVQYAARNQTVPVPSSIETGHFFLDPAHPQSRQFLTQLMQEIVSRYHPDGINFDYIRYPESAKPGTANYLDTTWGYTASAQKAFPAYVTWVRQQLKTLQQTEQSRIQSWVQSHQYFPPMVISPPTPLNPASYSPASQKTLAGLGLTSNLLVTLQKDGEEAALIKVDPFMLTPSEPMWPLWIRWRRSQVTSWLKQTQAELKKLQPNLTVSTVVFPLSDPESTVKLQSWPQWVKEGLVDALTPIGLNPTPSGVFQDGLNFLNQTQGKVPVYAGIFGIYNRYDPVDVVAQIDAVHRAGLAGVVLFEYSRLKDEYRDALKQGPFRE
ncbi:MAG: family 10 glycosylhydrolase [Cyanobacteria bacterium]|nr:family 10 glycosylhydrolase [Cyanobacteriota bacterium]